MCDAVLTPAVDDDADSDTTGMADITAADSGAIPGTYRGDAGTVGGKTGGGNEEKGKPAAAPIEALPLRLVAGPTRGAGEARMEANARGVGAASGTTEAEGE
jgi:hypothetical protein